MVSREQLPHTEKNQYISYLMLFSQMMPVLNGITFIQNGSFVFSFSEDGIESIHSDTGQEAIDASTHLMKVNAVSIPGYGGDRIVLYTKYVPEVSSEVQLHDIDIANKTGKRDLKVPTRIKLHGKENLDYDILQRYINDLASADINVLCFTKKTPYVLKSCHHIYERKKYGVDRDVVRQLANVCDFDVLIDAAI